MPKSKPIEEATLKAEIHPNGDGVQPPALTPEQRSRACWVDLQRVLEMYQCDLTAFPVFTAEGRVVANFRIVPRVLET